MPIGPVIQHMGIPSTTLLGQDAVENSPSARIHSALDIHNNPSPKSSPGHSPQPRSLFPFYKKSNAILSLLLSAWHSGRSCFKIVSHLHIWVLKASICSPFGGIQQRDCFKRCTLVSGLLLRTAVILVAGPALHAVSSYKTHS